MEFPGPGTAMAYASAIAIGASAYYSSSNEKIANGILIAGVVLALFTIWIEKIHTRKEVIKCIIENVQDEDKIEKVLKEIRVTGLFFTKWY
ncbi:hypothetical protein METP1_03090 [Methanosarcinales archaeon]|nr:hypothetical protein METP1_03090 [Methanosarcinales archaeon]